MALRAVTGILGLTLALTGSLPGCAASGSPAAEKDSSRAITALIGDAACDDDSQCRTIAMGSKACGGPEYYLAWSTKRTDANALRQAAVQELSAPRNPRLDPRMRSTCVIVADPGAYCATASGAAAAGARTQGGSCKLRGVDRGGGRVD